MNAQPSHVRVLAQTDPLANRLRTFGDDLRQAKQTVADLTHLLKRLDDEASSLTEAGVTMTYTLGPVGDAAGAARRDLEPRDRPTFTMPTGDTRG
jgi:hypothetical protein